MVTDVNDQVNIIGWGINYAARALQFSQGGQILCTEYFAKPLLMEHGDETRNQMISIGKQTIKEAKMELFNYHKENEYGTPVKKK